MQAAIESHEFFRLINDAHNGPGDAVFGIISGLGDGLIVALICTLLMLFHLRLGIASLAAFVASGLIAQGLKRMFDMPRPPAVLENVHVLGAPLTAHSFPSGHATSDGVVILAAFLLWGAKDWRAWAVAGVFALAAYGRIYGGVHFPLDVAVGLVVGMACMWGLWQWSVGWPVARWESSPWAWKIPGLGVAVQAAVLGLGYHVQPATAQPLAAIVPVAALVILMRVWRGKFGNQGSL
ncbi:MAG: phosphatase PAP2 family protein [Mariprofundaceae bacterium]|nr:phosphatase PAP2 family protein [Mariprofundaceae bacterium]